MNVIVETRDGVIWDKEQVILQCAKCMSMGDKMVIDLNNEGPDCQQIGLYDILNQCAKLFDYDLSKIELQTCNMMETHDTITITKTPSLHLLQRELKKGYEFRTAHKKTQLKHFGRFIGRSNAPRLILSAYLDEHYRDKSLLTYQYKHHDDYHRNEIGLESIINDYGIANIEKECKFLASCPRQIVPLDFQYNKDLTDDFSSQLHKAEQGKFIDVYSDFLVEVVSETYFNGNTFFLTEKIFRPILLKTPFIVQGPQWFLHHLRDLGFKTFAHWWDEGYSEDPADWQIEEIKKVIKSIASMSNVQLQQMYIQMQSVLEHNQKRLLKLTEKDFADLNAYGKV